MITVTLGYFDACPNWRTGRERLGEAVWRVGRDLFVVELRRVASHDQAVAAGFGGSPSFLIPAAATCSLGRSPRSV